MLKKYFDLLLGLIIIIYVITINIISSTRIAFSTPFMLFGIVFVAYHFMKKRIHEIINSKKSSKIVIRIFDGFIIIVIFILCAIEGFIIGYPKENTDKADYIIVLGAGLRNGNELSITLKDRLDAAVSVLDKDDFIVVSGGKGSDERLSEAEVMERYLIDCGVDENKIIKEDKSTNTMENLKYSKEKIEQNSKKSVNELKIKIVTTDFHACRAAYIAENNNYKNFDIYTSKSLYYLIPIYYTRESFAMLKTIINYI